MSDEDEQSYWKRKPPSLFFPLLLIGIGVVLLLKNVGIISGDLWDLFLKAWPVLLIVSGLDSIYRRDGIVGGVVWAGLGGIILLANLGYIPPIYWDVVLRIWPFALVVWGLDILLSRRNWWTAVLALLTGVVVVGLIYWVIMAAPVTRTMHNETFQTQSEGVQQASIVLESVTGKFSLQDGAAPDNLADGKAQLLTNEDLQLDYVVQDDTGVLTLKSDTNNGSQHWFPNIDNRREWQVNLSESMPLDISSKLIAGEQTADLSALQVDDVGVETVLGRTVITLPEESGGIIDLNVVMGDMVVYIPKGVPVTIELDTAITALDYPDDFERIEDTLRSPGGDAAGALRVRISLPIGSVRIRYIGY